MSEGNGGRAVSLFWGGVRCVLVALYIAWCVVGLFGIAVAVLNLPTIIRVVARIAAMLAKAASDGWGAGWR
jgi:hypothetical protein